MSGSKEGENSSESTFIPPMCPGSGESRARRHVWVEFVVGSCPWSEGFSPSSSVFLPLYTVKTNTANFQFDLVGV